VRNLRDTNVSGTILAQYSYSGGTGGLSASGSGRLAIADLQEPDIKLDYFQGTASTYAGLDRFGRVKDQFWDGYNSTADVDRIKYGHDYAGSRVYRDIDASIYAANTKDQAWTYDGLHRLKTSDEGTLSGSTISGTPAKEQDWSLDLLGNWSNFVAKTAGSTDLNQTRTVNAANEITAITESTGPAWIDPAYDAAGNMTTIPQPADLTAGYTGTYDAWNRLVKLADGMTTVAEYEYDGQNRRIVKVDKTGMADVTYDSYHNEEWQTLEVRKDADADPLEQYVWHLLLHAGRQLQRDGGDQLIGDRSGTLPVLAVWRTAGARCQLRHRRRRPVGHRQRRYLHRAGVRCGIGTVSLPEPIIRSSYRRIYQS